MKPLKILLFFAIVFGILFFISVIFPRDGLSLGEDIQLHFISFPDLFKKDTSSTAYTDSLILHTTVTDDPEFGTVDSVLFMHDSLADLQKDIILDSIIRARIDSISKRVYPIEFAVGSREDFYRFFKAADQSKEQGELIRILHYGDSQIENDRMTSLLRYRFQKVFGGSGCGIVPAIPLYFGNPAYKESFEGDWSRYTGFGKRDSTLEDNSYGLLDCFTSVPPPEGNTLPSLTFNFHKGRRASHFSRIKLYLNSYADSAMIAIQINDTIIDTITNVPAGYRELSYLTDIKAEKVSFKFKLKQGGRIYGIGFDPESGVQLDNIAMRGSSGLEFSNSDRHTLDTMLHGLNTGLIIMQFGGNVVPYINNTSYYKKSFKRELSYIKELIPGVAIVLVGPSDMATKENGKYITYPMVEAVRDLLRDAALESGCAFWDMYEAMGGENSIQNFVLADPPLATTDYIHFTAKGANMIAGMLFDAMMVEYSRYKVKGDL